MSNNRSAASLFIQATALAIVAAVGTLFCSLASAVTPRSSDHIFFHGNVGELTLFSISDIPSGEVPWVVWYENGGVIAQGTFTNVLPLNGASAQFTIPPTAIGGTPVVTFSADVNACDFLIDLSIKFESSTAPPVVVDQFNNANWKIYDNVFGFSRPCPNLFNGTRSNPNAGLTPGQIAVTPATNLVAALRNTGSGANAYCLALRVFDDFEVIDQKCTTVDGGKTGILTFGSPFPSDGFVVPVVCADGNPVSVDLDILQTVVTSGGQTQIRSHQATDADWEAVVDEHFAACK
jgi:hypothetical protein